MQFSQDVTEDLEIRSFSDLGSGDLQSPISYFQYGV
jgi:hypothetical protein